MAGYAFANPPYRLDRSRSRRFGAAGWKVGFRSDLGCPEALENALGDGIVAIDLSLPDNR